MRNVTHLTTAHIEQLRQKIGPEIAHMHRCKSALQATNIQPDPNPKLDQYIAHLEKLKSKLVDALNTLNQDVSLKRWERDIVLSGEEALKEIEEMIEIAGWFSGKSHVKDGNYYSL